MKKYQVIYADPPWEMVRSFGGTNWRNGERVRNTLDYPTMTLAEIKNLPIDSLSDKSTALYLWVTQRYLEESFGIVRGWGFKPVCTLAWCKPRGGFVGGAYFSNLEFLLYAKRSGSRINGKINSQWFELPRRKHSQKPDEFYEMIERVHNPPYLELFARQKVEGWDSIGFDIDGCDIRESLEGGNNV